MASGDEDKESKTLVLVGHGGYDQLQVETKTCPPPAEGEVMVYVKAAGINFAELMARQGMYDVAPKLPAVLGYEAAGDVVAVGPGVTDRKVGERVICMASFGLWSEYKNVESNRCFKMPDDMSYEEGAAIPVNYITAYHMLFNMAHISKGNKVLVHMVAGGVGFAATQLCKTIAETTVFGTCSAVKHDAVRANGVDFPIDYRTMDYEQEIRKICPEGVDIVLDPLNGADADKGYKLLKPMGMIVHFGAANVVTGQHRNLIQAAKTWWSTKSHNSLSMISDNKCRAGYHLGHLTKEVHLIREAALQMVELYKAKKIKPCIDSVWAFEDVGKAMARMHDRKNVGKVIISPQKQPGEVDIRACTK